MRRQADPTVIAWLDGQPPESIWTTTITVFEIRFGLEILARGRKRKALEVAFASALDEDFGGRVLRFDRAAAQVAAAIAARQREAGRPVEVRDVPRWPAAPSTRCAHRDLAPLPFPLSCLPLLHS